MLLMLCAQGNVLGRTFLSEGRRVEPVYLCTGPNCVGFILVFHWSGYAQ